MIPRLAIPIEIALTNPLLSAGGPPCIVPQVSERQRRSAVLSLQTMREAIRGGLPIYGSLIGLEVFLFLCERDLQGEPVPLKDLYLALGRSHGGVRRLVRELERDRWIRLENSGQDRRTHFVVPSARLRKAFAAFTASTGP